MNRRNRDRILYSIGKKTSTYKPFLSYTLNQKQLNRKCNLCKKSCRQRVLFAKFRSRRKTPKLSVSCAILRFIMNNSLKKKKTKIVYPRFLLATSVVFCFRCCFFFFFFFFFFLNKNSHRRANMRHYFFFIIGVCCQAQSTKCEFCFWISLMASKYTCFIFVNLIFFFKYAHR